MLTFIVLLFFLSLWTSKIHAQLYDVFKITAPKSGDTVTIGKYTTEGVTVPIEWTVLDELAGRPVLISLVQGNSLSSLEMIAQINSSAPNNGSYLWRGDSFDSALVFGYTHGAPSGCNFSIELKVWTDTAYSGYFTVINPDDGGLSATAECPSGDAIGPTSQTYTSISDGQASNDDNNESASSTSTGASSPTGASSTASSSSNSSKSSNGVSTTTLAVAVAVPIVVLLLTFGCIIWLGIRKGWFVRKSPRDESTVEKTNGLAEHGTAKPTGGIDDVRELHADDLPHQLDCSPVHELQGGDGGPGYGFRN